MIDLERTANLRLILVMRRFLSFQNLLQRLYNAYLKDMSIRLSQNIADNG